MRSLNELLQSPRGLKALVAAGSLFAVVVLALVAAAAVATRRSGDVNMLPVVVLALVAAPAVATRRSGDVNMLPSSCWRSWRQRL